MEIKSGQKVKINIEGKEVEGIITAVELGSYTVIYSPDGLIIEFETVKIQ